MVKRRSRENARDRLGSEDMVDNDGPVKKSRYNLRKRGPDMIPPPDKEELLWIDDDTLYVSSEDEEDIEETIKKLTPAKNKLFLTTPEKNYLKNLPIQSQKKIITAIERISKKSFEEGDIPYKFKIIDLPISDYMKSHILKKLQTLSELSSESGEYHKLRAWIDGLLRIPFGKTRTLPISLLDGRNKCSDFMKNSRKLMDSAIYGMKPAKIQIMQIISQWIVNPDSIGNVIALKGPAGVGKTSCAKNAIAKVLNRPFEFFSLGGASDISNFVGHSYTYEGSTWGRIIDSIMHSGCMNPVLYFDELDKISTTPHGEEITSMLIHLTDRSQNSQFHDRYFAGLEFDLSQCLFVFSLNDIEKVNPILKDRMTIIQCDGYNDTDKISILKDYVLPSLLTRLKFAKEDILFSDQSLKYLVTQYSQEEKGVRTLIRSVENLMTRINMLRISDDETYDFYIKLDFPLQINEKIIQTLLKDYSRKEPETWRDMYV